LPSVPTSLTPCPAYCPFVVRPVDEVGAGERTALPGDAGPCEMDGCAGELCAEENLELILDIHEFLLKADFASDCDEVATFSDDPRLSNAGLLSGAFVACDTPIAG